MNDHRQIALVVDGTGETTRDLKKDSVHLTMKPPLIQAQAIIVDCDTWQNYWRSKGQPWRTEQEIDTERKAEVEQCLALPRNTEGPFEGITLSRADIEYLLAKDEEPEVEQGNKQQRRRLSLDLRGANLRKVRLRGLPLAELCGGLTEEEWMLATDGQCESAAARFERADLQEVHLEGANLCGAHLEEADLRGAHLKGANLRGAHLAGANLCGSHLEGANLRDAHLEGNEEYPRAANLRLSFLDGKTNLEGIILGNERYGFAPLADVRWNNSNLAMVEWSQVSKIGDEYQVQWKLPVEYEAAIRANRQLATVLQAQGMSEDANYFLLRACMNERPLLLQRLLLPVAVRILFRERMPLPKVLLRLEERRKGQRYPRHPIAFALLRLVPLLLLLLLAVMLHPVVFLLFCTACALLSLSLLPTLRKRGRHPPQYGRAQRYFPPPGLLPQQQRRRLQWLLLLGFLLGTSKSQLSLLLVSPQAALEDIPTIKRLEKQWPLSSLLIPLLLFDDTLVCFAKYVFSSLEYVITGYGYKLTRCLCCYGIVLLGFSMLYFMLTQQTIWDAFALSVTSFHGLRFFLPRSTPFGNVPGGFPVVEAVFGLIFEITFFTALLRRFSRK